MEHVWRFLPTASLPVLLLMGIGFSTRTPSAAEASPPAITSTSAPSRSNEEGLIASPEPDWPQWQGPRRDGISQEKGLLPKWPDKGPPLLWKVGRLGRGWSSPIIVGKRLFISGDNGNELTIYCFDLDGKPVWKAKNGEAWTGSYPGARACCVYSEGKLYNMNGHGRVACLDARSGKELWACDIRQTFDAPDITWGFSECLLVDGPRLFVTPGGKKALVAALDKHTGKPLWTTPRLDEDCASHCSPILLRYAGRRILASCSSAHGFGVDAESGELLWSVPLKSPYKVNITSPVFHNGSIFYVTAYVFGACYKLESDAGGNLTAKKAWSTSLDSCTGAVLLLGDTLYGSGYERHRSWMCLDWATGKTRYESKKLTTSSAIHADGRLYCLAQDGRVALVDATPDEFKLVSQFRLVPQKTSDAWAYPVVLHGRLYLRYHGNLWCYDVGAK